MWRHFILVVIGISTATPGATAFAQDLERLKKGVVRVRLVSEGNILNNGGGFVVREESGRVYVLTAAHVVMPETATKEGKTEIEIEFLSRRNRPLTGSIVKGDPQRTDLAVLSVLIPSEDTPDLSVLALRTDVPVRPGDPVAVIGFPGEYDVPWSVTRGEVVGRQASTIVFSGDIVGGYSGGPLLKGDQVIGIVTDTVFRRADAVPALIAQYFLESEGIRFGVKLRSKPASLPRAYIAQMIDQKGFSHPFDLSREGLSGSVLRKFQHDFERKLIEGDTVVVDQATGLMWEHAGSKDLMRRDDVEGYLEGFNKEGYAGFKDWRLPTVEELASLLEPRGENERLYIAPKFFKPLLRCWSADDATLSEIKYGNRVYYDEPLFVDFAGGSVEHKLTIEGMYTNQTGAHVRAVRSLNEKALEELSSGK